MEWQTIETAPKDGSDILIWHLGRPYVASWAAVWHPDNKKWVVRGVQTHPDDQNRSVSDIGPDYERDGSLNIWSRPGPSHWMPLPPPPGEDSGIPVYKTGKGETEVFEKGE